MTVDLRREIEVALTTLIDPALHDSVTVADALRAALAEHQHTLLNEWFRETDEIAEAKYGSCATCGNNTALWCATVIAAATALGIPGDPPADGQR